MSKWVDKCETVLTDIGIPFAFERFESADEHHPQLPDTYIVYFLVDDSGLTWSEGKETSHEPRIQISLFYRDKSEFLTIPDQIETAFMTAKFLHVGSGRIPYQTDTRHYGWRCDFRFYERR